MCLVPDCSKHIVAKGLCDTHYRRLLRRGTLELKPAIEKTRAYIAWQNMLRRCDNQSHPGYHNYGGRGIIVCQEWHRFSQFLIDMGEPSPGMTIERINNDGNYKPSNCRWATRKEQSVNRRTARLITFKGETKNMQDWATELGVTPSFLHYRIVTAGWSVEAAFTKPKVVGNSRRSHGSYGTA